MTSGKPDSDISTQELNLQTATVDWNELIRHFARGVLIHVDANLDLVDVAHRIASDDVLYVERFLQSGLLRRASDDDARDWNSRAPTFWCVVAAPWVLIQERVYEENIH